MTRLGRVLQHAVVGYGRRKQHPARAVAWIALWFAAAVGIARLMEL